jgi:predicted transposase YdaD
LPWLSCNILKSFRLLSYIARIYEKITAAKKRQWYGKKGFTIPRVVNMLFGEWKLEDALVVEREEGREKRETEIAKNALAKGLPAEMIREITGLSAETIQSLATR